METPDRNGQWYQYFLTLFTIVLWEQYQFWLHSLNPTRAHIQWTKERVVRSINERSYPTN